MNTEVDAVVQRVPKCKCGGSHLGRRMNHWELLRHAFWQEGEILRLQEELAKMQLTCAELRLLSIREKRLSVVPAMKGGNSITRTTEMQ